MPQIDNKSKTQVLTLDNVVITGNGVTFTPSLDSAHYDNGVTFVPALIIGDGTTEVAVTNIQDSPDNSVWTDVIDENIIGDLTDLLYIDATASGDEVPSVGVISTDQFLRLELTTSNFNTDSTMIVTVNAGVEVSPANS